MNFKSSIATKHRMAVLSIAATMVLSSCGDGGKAPGKGDYLRQASAICKKGVEAKELAMQKRFQALSKPKQKPARSDYEAMIAASLPPLRKMTQELADLAVPSGGAQLPSKMVDQLETALKKAEEDPGGVLRADPFITAGATARSYGIAGCEL